MNLVFFKNDGVIDLTSVTTFGVNAKETDNPFGFFGTGLKYAIAILLREKQTITIHTGLEAHVFTTVTKTIRDKEFDIVCMDGAELGFTLELGKAWELWQAYRELYCNTMDEGGVITANNCSPEEGSTLIVVDGGAFQEIHENRHKIILNSEPFFKENGVDAHLGESNYMYMNTVRVAQLSSPSIYTYNLTRTVTLTEDRTIKEQHEADTLVRRAVLCGDNDTFIKAFATAPEGTYEQKLDCNGWCDTPSAVFIETIKTMQFKDITNSSLLAFHRKHTEIKKTPKPAAMTDIEKKQLERAIVFCKGIGYEVDSNVIHVSDDLNERVLGMVFDGDIYLSRRVFQQGTKQVAATLLEEHLHIEKRFNDETYAFQTYLFDVIMTLGEQVNGEPL
jgi:hypothetical protein